jgi:PKD repeat protein
MKNSTFFSRTAALFASLLLVTAGLQAQNWKQPMSDPTANFYDIQTKFNQDMGRKEREIERERQAQASRNNGSKGTSGFAEENEQEMEGYLQYKRWEYYMAPRVYPSGNLTLPSTTWGNFENYLNSNPDAMLQYMQTRGAGNYRMSGPGNSIMSSTWTFAGPTGAPTGAGAGRINFVRFDPTNSNTIWVGAPDGGLWKSTNGGASWTTNTDFLTVIGATDVAIDPTNTQIMYLATGDGDAGDSYSIGVLKSIDGGGTWNTTSLTWTVNQGRVISKLLINPSNTQIIMAFSNVGIWRTTDGGINWTQVQTTSSFKDAEFKPGDPTTIYAAGTRFWKSTDSGVTWVNTAVGLPANTSVDRFAIAVSQDPTGTGYVYILAGSAANDGFFGFYRSTDSGANFTTRSTTPNILGWASAGNDVGGQGWYDLAVASSPTNKDVVITGGVNIWRSTNGGTNWTLNGHWTGSGAPYVHADVHDLIFLPGNGTTYFAGCDGGVFKTVNSGSAWTDLSNNLCIAQIYRIGLSTSNASYWITGHQDNGTNLKNGAPYVGTMGGDGMDCFVDRTNNNVMYGSQYSGSLNRTTNGGANWTGINTGLTGTAPWVTAWYQDPTTANTLYCGRSNLFRSTNQGTGWAAVASAVPGTGTIVDFKIAPSNNQTIYVVRSNGVYKTTNAGGAWTTITGTLPVGSAAITRVDVKPTDPNTVIVTFSGYSAGNKVFKTTNGGTSWTNISTGLPNLPVNCVRFDASSLIEGVYVGSDVGVYYMDNTFTSWQPYFTGLPNCQVADLEVYTPTGKLRAATYGRGVWEVDIYNPGTLAPIADFNSNKRIICPSIGVNFTDMSSFTPTSWSWTFQGGTPATSTVQNPTGVTWTTPGTYSVSLTATNGNGSDVETKLTYITVLGSQAPPLVEGFEAVTFLPTGWTPNNVNNDALFWTRATTGFSSTASAMFDNYNLDVAGARDEMWAPRLNTTGFTTLSLAFDVAYARYDATYSDTLEVLVSTDCGTTWNTVYLKGGGPVGGSALATAPDQTATIFVPTAGQWRNETVNLNTYANQASVLVIFRNRGHYGQALYVDNINITGTASALPSATFTTSATSICAGTPVNFTSTSTGGPTSWSWTFPSGTPGSATTQNVTGVVWNAPGTYTVTHTATNGSGTGTTTQVITVNANPTVTTTASSTTICSGSSTTLTGAGASTYSWNPGALSGTSVTVSPTLTTTYTVVGTAANGCTGQTTRLITVNPSPTVTVTASSTTICSGSSTTLTATGASTYLWNPGALTGSSVTVNPTLTTTYTVTGTAANGCVNTVTQLITVNPSPTVTTTASSTTICSGNSTTLTGVGASTYVWNPGNLTGTSVTVSPTLTTTYTLVGTAANGCTGQTTRLITVNPTPTVTVSASSTTICSGTSTTLTATGGTTYVWNPGNLTGSSITVNPTLTTTYTVTGTSVGCSSTSTQLITVNPSPTVTTTASSTTICSGNSTTLTGTGASTYVWNPGNLSGTSVTVSPTLTTTYTVVGTAANGCTGQTTRLITVNPSPTVTATASSTSICTGGSTTLTVTGASTYNWQPGNLSGTSVTVTPTSTTTYTVTGTAANGCTNVSTITINVGSAPTVTASASNATICSGSTTTLTAAGATTYTWQPGNLTGTSITVSPTLTTTYTVTGVVGVGCQNTATVLVTVNPSPTVTNTASSTTICSGNSTTLTGAGASTYVWNPGNLSGTSVTVSPTLTTTYTVTGTAANGCTANSTRLITVNPSPTVTATATNNAICTGTTITLSATGASTYNWQPGNLNGASVTLTPTTTTTYTVTGTAANGCTSSSTQLITVTPSPTVTATASTTSICDGGSTTLTATGATTYTWNPGNLTGSSVTVSPTLTTTYTVSGSNGGCSTTATQLITVNPNPTVTATASSTTICDGSSTTLSATGASTYTWNPGNLSGTSVSVNPTITTTYTVTGTSASGCTNSSTQLITVNPSPTVTATASSNSVCSGNSVTLTGSGANTFTWNPGNLTGTTITVSPTSTTTYTVVGIDANGCSNTSQLTISVGTTPTVTATSSNSTVCSGSSVTLNASGASTYNWMPGNLSGATVTDTPTGTTTYTVIGTDVSGCTNSSQVTVTVNPSPTVTVLAGNNTLCAGNNVTMNASGASSYVWMPGNLTGSSITTAPASTTTYTITGTDINGCTNSGTVTITVYQLPTVTVTGNNTICEGDTLTLTGGGASSYDWLPNGQTTVSITEVPNTSTTYTVTGTDAFGCSNTATYGVTVNPLPTTPTVLVNGNVLTSSVTGASYQWYLNGNPIAGATSQSYTATQTGNYTVEVISADGCTSLQSNPVVDPTGISSVYAYGTIITVAPNPNNGEFNLTVNAPTVDDYVIEIHNALGQIVYTETLKNFRGLYNKDLDLSIYERGVYTVRVRSAHSDTVLKLVTY